MAVMDFRESNRTKFSFIINRLRGSLVWKPIFHNYEVPDKAQRISIFYPILFRNKLLASENYKIS